MITRGKKAQENGIFFALGKDIKQLKNTFLRHSLSPSEITKFNPGVIELNVKQKPDFNIQQEKSAAFFGHRGKGFTLDGAMSRSREKNQDGCPHVDYNFGKE